MLMKRPLPTQGESMEFKYLLFIEYMAWMGLHAFGNTFLITLMECHELGCPNQGERVAINTTWSMNGGWTWNIFPLGSCHTINHYG